ncbi:MAG: hypothetical protein DVB31_06250 [Verrucomicrobia bacterium]|nr:MAG: hypothetical protein DVB31_06250 [Verrucomicrobiota bacterium]
MNLRLSPAERAGLRAVAADFRTTPAALLLQFVRDLTGSNGNGGSDERDFADQWAMRSLRRDVRPKTAAERARWERLEAKAQRLRDAELAAWRAGRAAAQGKPAESSAPNPLPEGHTASSASAQ